MNIVTRLIRGNAEARAAYERRGRKRRELRARNLPMERVSMGYITMALAMLVTGLAVFVVRGMVGYAPIAWEIVAIQAVVMAYVTLFFGIVVQGAPPAWRDGPSVRRKGLKDVARHVMHNMVYRVVQVNKRVPAVELHLMISLVPILLLIVGASGIPTDGEPARTSTFDWLMAYERGGLSGYASVAILVVPLLSIVLPMRCVSKHYRDA